MCNLLDIRAVDCDSADGETYDLDLYRIDEDGCHVGWDRTIEQDCDPQYYSNPPGDFYCANCQMYLASMTEVEMHIGDYGDDDGDGEPMPSWRPSFGFN